MTQPHDRFMKPSCKTHGYVHDGLGDAGDDRGLQNEIEDNLILSITQRRQRGFKSRMRMGLRCRQPQQSLPARAPQMQGRHLRSTCQT